jgi:hypothetical protein
VGLKFISDPQLDHNIFIVLDHLDCKGRAARSHAFAMTFVNTFFDENKKTVEKSFFFLSNMKFCFMKRLFYTALEETMSMASQKKSGVVAGRVLNFGTKEGTTSFEPIERPITCVSALYNARQAS